VANHTDGDFIMIARCSRRYSQWSVAILLLVGLFVVTGHCLAQQVPLGYFVLQGVDKNNVKDAALRAPSVTGLSIRVSWASLDNGPYFQWGWLDSQVQRCRVLGKRYMLRMSTGQSSPRWIQGAWYNGAPLPWNTAAQDALADAIAALGSRYSGDPLLVGVHLTSTANHASSEMHIAPGLTSVNGYSDAKMIDAWETAIDSYGAAFPNCALILNATLEPNHRGGITHPVIAYCQQRLGFRATFQHNSLKASTPIGARHHQLILGLGLDSWRIGFQMASASSSRARFGGSLQEAIERAPGASYFELYQDDVGQ
jgi:hypothetical protein